MMYTVYLTFMIFCIYVNKAESGQLCVSCRDSDNLESCMQFEKCENDQVCYLQKFRTDQYQIKYESGCTYPNVCSDFVSPGLVGKRKVSGVHVLCQKCCNDTLLCNRNDLCSNPIGHLNPRQCSACSEITDPKNCAHTVSCDKDEVCFLHKYSHESEDLYSLGCKKYTLCGRGEIVSTVFGKRSSQGYRLICHHCCDNEDNCNSKLMCENHNNITHNKFLILFLENYSESNTTQSLFIVGTHSTGSCKIHSEALYKDTVQVTTDTTAVYEFNASMSSSTEIRNKGLYVECNVPVNVYGLNSYSGSTDGFYALPEPILGNEYIISTYMPSDDEKHSLFGVTTTHNNTKLFIRLKTSGGSAEFNHMSFKNNAIINVTLNALETFEISCKYCDLSGTFVSSNNPVAIIAGHDCFKFTNEYCSHASEMIFPVSLFSTKFVLPLLDNLYGGKVRIFAEHHASISSNIPKHLSVDSKGYNELDYSEIHYIDSSSPVMVMSFLKDFINDGNVFMMTIPGVDQYLSFYSFHVVQNFNSSLSFIVKSTDINGIRLDGKLVYSLIQKNVILNNEQYSTFSIEVLPGHHTAESVSGSSFALFVYGVGVNDSYGYPAGFK